MLWPLVFQPCIQILLFRFRLIFLGLFALRERRKDWGTSSFFSFISSGKWHRCPPWKWRSCANRIDGRTRLWFTSQALDDLGFPYTEVPMNKFSQYELKPEQVLICNSCVYFEEIDKVNSSLTYFVHLQIDCCIRGRWWNVSYVRCIFRELACSRFRKYIFFSFPPPENQKMSPCSRKYLFRNQCG